MGEGEHKKIKERLDRLEGLQMDVLWRLCNLEDRVDPMPEQTPTTRPTQPWMTQTTSTQHTLDEGHTYKVIDGQLIDLGPEPPKHEHDEDDWIQARHQIWEEAFDAAKPGTPTPEDMEKALAKRVIKEREISDAWADRAQATAKELAEAKEEIHALRQAAMHVDQELNEQWNWQDLHCSQREAIRAMYRTLWPEEEIDHDDPQEAQETHP